MHRRPAGWALLASLGVVCVTAAAALTVHAARAEPEVRLAPAGIVAAGSPGAGPSPEGLVSPVQATPTITSEQPPSTASPPAPTSPATSSAAVLGVPPQTVLLPGIPNAARVLPVGVLPDGEMQIPDDPSTVGWWAGGAAPGDASGSVLLVGHIDSSTQGLGVFSALPRVSVGQSVVLTDQFGQRFEYRVSGQRQVAKAKLTPELLQASVPGGLVLVTCGGSFSATSHYSDNVLVYAEPA